MARPPRRTWYAPPLVRAGYPWRELRRCARLTACAASPGGNFDKTGGLLGGTMKRLDALAQTKHGRHMIYLALFVCCVFVLLYMSSRR
ncbi:hypothetical protein T492DRAFT_1072721 [Pavlovales sp. CCMP2436]|nr:hypothetical protein T492DRAFT_1072721 [Pavlovales sp. CCMP2436]